MSPHASTDFLIEVLTEHVYLGVLPRTEIEDLAACAEKRLFQAGQILFLEGAPSSGPWFIEQGRVKVYKLSQDGREQILHFFGVPQSINEVSMFGRRTNPVNCSALTDGRAWLLPTDAVLAVVRRNPDLALAMLDVITGRLRSMVQQIEDLAFYPVIVRLARFLNDQPETVAFEDDSISRVNMASRLATTPETISRSLRYLQKAGVIRAGRQQIKVVNPEELRLIADMI